MQRLHLRWLISVLTLVIASSWGTPLTFGAIDCPDPGEDSPFEREVIERMLSVRVMRADGMFDPLTDLTKKVERELLDAVRKRALPPKTKIEFIQDQTLWRVVSLDFNGRTIKLEPLFPKSPEMEVVTRVISMDEVMPNRIRVLSGPLEEVTRRVDGPPPIAQERFIQAGENWVVPGGAVVKVTRVTPDGSRIYARPLERTAGHPTEVLLEDAFLARPGWSKWNASKVEAPKVPLPAPEPVATQLRSFAAELTAKTESQAERLVLRTNDEQWVFDVTDPVKNRSQWQKMLSAIRNFDEESRKKLEMLLQDSPEEFISKVEKMQKSRTYSEAVSKRLSDLEEELEELADVYAATLSSGSLGRARLIYENKKIALRKQVLDLLEAEVRKAEVVVPPPRSPEKVLPLVAKEAPMVEPRSPSVPTVEAPKVPLPAPEPVATQLRSFAAELTAKTESQAERLVLRTNDEQWVFDVTDPVKNRSQWQKMLSAIRNFDEESRKKLEMLLQDSPEEFISKVEKMQKSRTYSEAVSKRLSDLEEELEELADVYAATLSSGSLGRARLIYENKKIALRKQVLDLLEAEVRKAEVVVPPPRSPEKVLPLVAKEAPMVEPRSPSVPTVEAPKVPLPAPEPVATQLRSFAAELTAKTESQAERLVLRTNDEQWVFDVTDPVKNRSQWQKMLSAIRNFDEESRKKLEMLLQDSPEEFISKVEKMQKSRTYSEAVSKRLSDLEEELEELADVYAATLSSGSLGRARLIYENKKIALRKQVLDLLEAEVRKAEVVVPPPRSPEKVLPLVAKEAPMVEPRPQGVPATQSVPEPPTERVFTPHLSTVREPVAIRVDRFVAGKSLLSFEQRVDLVIRTLGPDLDLFHHDHSRLYQMMAQLDELNDLFANGRLSRDRFLRETGNIKRDLTHRMTQLLDRVDVDFTGDLDDLEIQLLFLARNREKLAKLGEAMIQREGRGMLTYQEIANESFRVTVPPPSWLRPGYDVLKEKFDRFRGTFESIPHTKAEYLQRAEDFGRKQSPDIVTWVNPEWNGIHKVNLRTGEVLIVSRPPGAASGTEVRFESYYRMREDELDDFIERRVKQDPKTVKSRLEPLPKTMKSETAEWIQQLKVGDLIEVRLAGASIPGYFKVKTLPRFETLPPGLREPGTLPDAKYYRMTVVGWDPIKSRELKSATAVFSIDSQGYYKGLKARPMTLEMVESRKAEYQRQLSEELDEERRLQEERLAKRSEAEESRRARREALKKGRLEGELSKKERPDLSKIQALSIEPGSPPLPVKLKSYDQTLLSGSEC